MAKRKRNLCAPKTVVVYWCTYYDVQDDCTYRKPYDAGTSGCVHHRCGECYSEEARRAARRKHGKA